MDNRIISQLLRGLKVTTGYITTLILFFIFIMPIITIARDSSRSVITIFSFLVFIVLFFVVYTDMRNIALKEKRPQYNINHFPFKGFLYGFIGIVPLVLVQSVLLGINFPQDMLVFKRRMYQGFAGPLYWFSRLLGDAPVHYVVSFAVLIIIAGLGYYAGYKEFYLVGYLRKRLGISLRKKPNRTNTQTDRKGSRILR